ncbi:methionyl-tRNA formyltransferase [Sinimarinibacterium sp. NLF-5-8]|uniref:methionyl-tRNA formyltransferase n=1 Tax=Sinimarinibacterium sp. NLF-5-8 TaxID=2698684 RepID=UPI00137BBE48|nr:methionyl-tRNA formyltransferase [Sinimarinibacterium sp. NLF-5-8]QHS10636.1 methionyl-tRNA formyltransferase [Sinimarinibacterium sp. NLF-5-8]
MRIVFAGTPDFAAQALRALHAAGHQIVGVFTQPDRPAGRGRKLMASRVAETATALGLTVHKPERLDAQAQATLRALAPEVMVVVAYGLILPQAVLDIPAHGCLNIHASLLPRWRGAAPIQRAIEAGDAETGVTIMRMDAGLDTGPMLMRESLPIDEHSNAGMLHDALAQMGARLIVQTLAQLPALDAQPQPAEGVSYAHKLSKDQARIDWQASARDIARRIRAFNPVPVAWSLLGDQRVRFFAARAHMQGHHNVTPGTVLADGLSIACGEGTLQVESLQWPGGRVLSAAEIAQGQKLVGRVLG